MVVVIMVVVMLVFMPMPMCVCMTGILLVVHLMGHYSFPTVLLALPLQQFLLSVFNFGVLHVQVIVLDGSLSLLQQEPHALLCHVAAKLNLDILSILLSHYNIIFFEGHDFIRILIFH